MKQKKLDPKKVLITGANGFIGKKISRSLKMGEIIMMGDLK